MLHLCSLATAAQLAAVAALGWRFAACPPVAWLLQTLAFVAFNKVRTQMQGADVQHSSSGSHKAAAAADLRQWQRSWNGQQLPVLSAAGWCVLLQVVTAQYFVWYFSLAPLALCRLHPGSQVIARRCNTTCRLLLDGVHSCCQLSHQSYRTASNKFQT